MSVKANANAWPLALGGDVAVVSQTQLHRLP